MRSCRSAAFSGAGDKLFAVPWSALTLDTDNKCFLLQVDKDRLKDAPGFDKDRWPSMADTEWATNGAPLLRRPTLLGVKLRNGARAWLVRR